MTTARAERTRRGSPAAWGLGGAVALMTLAVLVPAVTGWYVHVNHFPPLHADWAPRTGPGTVPALVLGVLGAQRGVDLADRLAWRPLLWWAFLVGLAWMLALAFVDGTRGVSEVLGTPYEYLRTARRTTDLHATLQGFVSRIPQSAAPHNWPVHVAGHPPGALLFFVVLVRMGLGGGLTSGLVVTVLAATTAVAVLVTLRTLGAERQARRAAPFLVLGPAAVWQCVSADGMFAAFAGWGTACLAIAATRRTVAPRVGWSVAAGLLLGWCVMLSYGLPLLGLLAVAVAVVARDWRPLPLAGLAALAVVAGFWLLGFSYLDALPAIHTRYWEAVGGRRQLSYWAWGDLAAIAFSAGPLAGAGLAHLVAGSRGHLGDASDRVVVWLAGAGAAMVLVADLSAMSKAEVERIWLPFVPWLLLSCALLPEPWRRRGLVVQVVLALVIQHLLFTGW
jgi:methylthioxylose transferase